MRNINLAQPDNSGIKFKVSRFPDGQQDITILDAFNLTSTRHMPVQIKSRFNNFRDLELIICATKALRNLGFEEIHLFIPYILGARSDRQFVEGGTSYLRDVIAPILNAQDYKSVTCIDAHSDVAAGVINRLKVESNIALVDFMLKTAYGINSISVWDKVKDNVALISPDGGALKKVYKIAEHLKTNEVIIANKHRDVITGNILDIEVTVKEDQKGKDFIILDDICDGGRTFIELAKALNIQSPKSRIFLVVTHGIFSAGFSEISKYLDGVFSTNSYADHTGFVEQLKVL